MLNLNQIKCFLLDLDGTLYLGDSIFSGTLPFLETLRQKGYKAVFLTNNSSKNIAKYLEKLNRIGIPAVQEQIMSSSLVAALYCKEFYPEHCFYVLGNEYLKKELQNQGVSVAEKNADAVLIGFDPTMVYDQLFCVCNYVKQGLPYIATHPDVNCPFENGMFLPDVGSTISFIQTSTGRLPDKILGKPSDYLLTCIKRRLGLQNNQLCMVGDRLNTDIAMGTHGISTVLLYSGVTTPEQALKSDIKADLQFQNIDRLTEYIQRNT